MNHSINVGGRLLSLDTPIVMGILNVTPDSFYSASRKQSEKEIAERVRQIAEEGAGIIDVGAYSSRPGADDVDAEEETERLRHGLAIVRREAGDDVLVSVDTFRADVARLCVEEFGVQIVNDISGGELDREMFSTVAQLHVPYVLMHMQGTPRTMQVAPHYNDLMRDICLWFARRVQRLRSLGARDLILDPGFGFGKTLGQNYELLHHLGDLAELELPILVGVSRKSMIYKFLGGTPETSLNGTTVLHALALERGARILRAHDVKEAVEAVRLWQKTQQGGQGVSPSV